MFGMKKLFLHMMYINHREQLEPMSEYESARVLLLALAACYHHGYDIEYDYLIEKSLWGAKLDAFVEREWKTYTRSKINVKAGVKIEELEKDYKLDEKLKKIIELNSNDYRALPELIMSLKSYRKDYDEIEKISKEDNWLKQYPYWSKKEIISIFGKPKKNIDDDSRIPLNRSKYCLMQKYLKLNDYFNDVDKFTARELWMFREMPSHLIKNIEENGCYHDKSLD